MINLRRSAVALMAVTVVGYAFSFGKEMIVASFFGAGREMDAYYAALTLPNFMVSLLAFSVTSVLVPAYVTWKVERPELASGIARLALRDLPICLGVLAVAMAAGAGPLIHVLFPGLPASVAARAVELERIMAWAAVSMGGGALIVGLLNAEGSFSGPSLSSIIVTAAIVVSVLLLRKIGATSLAIGLLAGTFLQAAWLASRWRAAVPPASGRALRWSDPEVRTLLPFLITMIATYGMADINTVVDRFMASMLPEGSVASMGYVLKLMSVPSLVLIAPVTAVAFPIMAERMAKGDEAGLEADFKKACRLGYALLLPATAFLMRFAGVIIVVLFQRGRFDPTATHQVARAFTFYAVSLPFTVPLFLVSRLTVIEKDAVLLLRFGVFAVLLNLGLDWTLMRVWSPPVAGITFSSSLTIVAALIVYALALRRTHRWMGLGAVLGPALPYLLPTAAMMIAAEAAFRLSWGSPLPRLAFAGCAGAATLALVAHGLKLDEMVKGLAYVKTWGREASVPATLAG